MIGSQIFASYSKDFILYTETDGQDYRHATSGPSISIGYGYTLEEAILLNINLNIFHFIHAQKVFCYGIATFALLLGTYMKKQESLA